MVFIGIAVVVLLLLGFPIWLVLLALSVAVLSLSPADIPPEMLASRMFSSLNVYALLAVPGFIFAAEVMVRGGMSKRLVLWIATLLGKVPGGVPVTTIAASEVFGAISGSSTATVAGVGKVLYPGLRESNYSEHFSLGLITSMGAIAVIIPPSITMIIYGAVAPASVGTLFIAGLIPGILIGLAVAVYSVWYAMRHSIVSTNQAWDLKLVLQATLSAIWTLGAPVIIFGGIYTGFFTPTEASMVLAAYAVLVSMVIYRELNLRGFWHAILDSAFLTAKIFVIVAAASIFSLVLVIENVPDTIVGGLMALDMSPMMVLLMINLILLVAGMFMDPNSAIVVLVPLLLPVAVAVGVDVIHFGIIMTVNLAIGMFTPPFGLNLFVSTSIFNVPVVRVVRGVIPFVFVYLAALMLITYV
ncbi:MAG: TRAP transporter large permease, partial [Aquisalimonadaceae bacterium]